MSSWRLSGRFRQPAMGSTTNRRIRLSTGALITRLTTLAGRAWRRATVATAYRHGQHVVIGRHIEDVAVVPRAETGSDPNHSIDDRADERDLPAWDSRLLPREKLHTLGTAPQRGFDFFVRNRSHRLIP